MGYRAHASRTQLSPSEKRRLERLPDMPVERLPLSADEIPALGFARWSCVDVAGRSRLRLDTNIVMSRDENRILTMLGRSLAEGRTTSPLSIQVAPDARATQTDAIAAPRAVRLA